MASLEDDVAESPRHRGRMVDRLTGTLRDGILNSRFAPGQRLIEADLTRELGVSRGPLREAFRRLSAEGLIEIVPNRGAMVRRLSFRETVELFQIRTELEALAARLAAGNVAADSAARTRFQAAIAPIWSDEPRLSSPDYLDENRRFHDAVVAASGNTQLAIVSRQFQLPLIMGQLSNALTADILRHSVTEHRLIARAILNGDTEAAEAAMRAHLGRAAAFAEGRPEGASRGGAR